MHHGIYEIPPFNCTVIARDVMIVLSLIYSFTCASMSARNLKGLCHGRLVQFVNVNYASLCAMKLNLSEESTWKWQNHSVCPNSQVLQFFLFFYQNNKMNLTKTQNHYLYLKSSPCCPFVPYFVYAVLLMAELSRVRSTIGKKIWLSMHPRNFGFDKIVRM